MVMGLYLYLAVERHNPPNALLLEERSGTKDGRKSGRVI